MVNDLLGWDYNQFRYQSLTLLWYPEWFSVSWQDLMHDSSELIQHLQALLLPHAGVVEAREPWLDRQNQDKRTEHYNLFIRWTNGHSDISCLICIRVKLSDWFLFSSSPLRPQWGWVLSLSPDIAVAPSRQWPLPSRVFGCYLSRTCRTRRWG